MKRGTKRRVATAALALALVIGAFLAVGCSVGGGGTPSATSQNITTQSGANSTAAFAIFVPTSTQSSARARTPRFVAQSTLGISISNFVHGSGTPSFTASADLSVGSTNCTATANGRNCAVTMTVVGGNDDFTVATYDVAPSNANFGAAAHKLGSATLTSVVIMAGQVNVVNVALGGIVKTVRLLASKSSAYGPISQTEIIGVQGFDADNNVVIAGAQSATNGGTTQTDTYANFITVSLSEVGGGGHSTLSLNGGAPGTSVIVTKSSDIVTFAYDGNAAPGYYATIKGAATGAATATQTVNSLFVNGTSGPGTFAAGANPTLAFSVLNQPETITITEPNFANSFQVTAPATSTNCPANSISLNATGLAGNGNTFTLTAGSVITVNNGCIFTITDGATTVQLGVTDVTASVIIQIPNPLLYFTTFSTPSTALGPWPASTTPNLFNGGSAPSSPRIVRYDPSTATTTTFTNGSLVMPVAIADDSNGNMYVADYLAHAIFEFAASASGNAGPIATIQSSSLSGPTAIALDSSGNMYVADYTNQTVLVFAAGSSGPSVTPTSIMRTKPDQSGLTLDSAGDVFVSTSGGVFEYGPPAPGLSSPSALRTFPIGSSGGIALDANGNLFAANTANNIVFEFPATGASNPSATQSFRTGFRIGSPSISGVALDPQGTLYIGVAGTNGNLAYQTWNTATGLQTGSVSVPVFNSSSVSAQMGLIAR